MRRFLIGSIGAFLLLPASVVFAAQFSDVDAKHPSAYAIQVLKDGGIISGYPDGTFKPEASINRAEAAAIIMKAAGIDAPKSDRKLPFTDVPETAWFYSRIQKGYAMGKLKGYPDKTFRPQASVTLPEALAFITSFYSISTKGIAIDSVIYEGLDTKEWYGPVAQYAKNTNLITPDENGHVEAAKPLSRAALAELVFRMRVIKQTGADFDITSGWIVTEHTDNYWKIKHPAQWEIFMGVSNSVVWKRSEGQTLFSHAWPQGAKISLSLLANEKGISTATFFANTRESYMRSYGAVKPTITETRVSGRNALRVSVPSARLLDTYIEVPGPKFLAIYAEWGDSALGEFIHKQVDIVVNSYQYVEKPPVPPVPVIPLERRLEMVREKILVADGWKGLKDLFSDKKLFSTDAIGIGTGPVDYFYVPEGDKTIKVERNSATVLNMKDGQTTSF